MKAQCEICRDVLDTRGELRVCKCKKSYILLTEDSLKFGGFLRRLPADSEES